MTKQSFGATIASLRKERGMTQLDLAQLMGVTDKAVSKWERDLSFPDVASLPKLAEVLGASVDELLEVKSAAQEPPASERASAMIGLVLRAVGLAMGVAVAVLTFMDKVDLKSACGMLGIGLACLGIAQISDRD